MTVSLTLPVYPVGSTGFKIGMGPDPDMGETVGWDSYIHTVAEVAATIPAAQAAHTIILASNYGEAAALYLARREHPTVPLPPVYSGDNAFWYWGPPPQTATEAIVVGDFPAGQLHAWYTTCVLRARLHSPPGVANDEAGQPVRWCTGRTAPWAQLWPQVKTLG